MYGWQAQYGWPRLCIRKCRMTRPEFCTSDDGRLDLLLKNSMLPWFTPCTQSSQYFISNFTMNILIVIPANIIWMYVVHFCFDQLSLKTACYQHKHRKTNKRIALNSAKSWVKFFWLDLGAMRPWKKLEESYIESWMQAQLYMSFFCRWLHV